METLKEVRKRREFKQGILAKIVGISQTELSLIENGHSFPSAQTRERLELILGPINWHLAKPEVMYGMISNYVGRDAKRAQKLKNFIDRVLEVSRLNIINVKQKIK